MALALTLASTVGRRGPGRAHLLTSVVITSLHPVQKRRINTSPPHTSHLTPPCAHSVHILSGDSQGAVNHMAALAGVDAAQVSQGAGCSSEPRRGMCKVGMCK